MKSLFQEKNLMVYLTSSLFGGKQTYTDMDSDAKYEKKVFIQGLYSNGTHDLMSRQKISKLSIF